MLCDFKVMQLGGIHRIQLAHVFGTAAPSNHNRGSPSTSVTDRASRMRLPLGRTWATSAMTRAVKESSRSNSPSVSAGFEWCRRWWAVLGLGWFGLSCSFSKAEVGPLVDSGVQVSPPLGGEFRRRLAATVFTDQHFDQIVFVEGSRFVLARSVSHLQVAGVPWITGRHCLRGLWSAASGHLHAGQRWEDGWSGWPRTEAGPRAVKKKTKTHQSVQVNPPSVPPHRPSGGCRAESLHHRRT